ncbi:MAG TPA: hypothetical protein VGI19_14610 [Candidatus Cybelea sp.]|jgi:hypothetical protein
MSWEIEYYEMVTGDQPAETFEDNLPMKLRARLTRFTEAVAESEGTIGGGYWEPCHDWPGLFEVRAQVARDLGRYYATVDGLKLVLLHGYQKRHGEPTPQAIFQEADGYRQDYERNRRISPEQT